MVMKKISFSLLSLLLIGGSSCQENIDIEKEIDHNQVVDTIVRDTRFDVLSLNLCRDEDSGIRLLSRDKEAVTESPALPLPRRSSSY